MPFESYWRDKCTLWLWRSWRSMERYNRQGLPKRTARGRSDSESGPNFDTIDVSNFLLYFNISNSAFRKHCISLPCPLSILSPRCSIGDGRKNWFSDSLPPTPWPALAPSPRFICRTLCYLPAIQTFTKRFVHGFDVFYFSLLIAVLTDAAWILLNKIGKPFSSAM